MPTIRIEEKESEPENPGRNHSGIEWEGIEVKSSTSQKEGVKIDLEREWKVSSWKDESIRHNAQGEVRVKTDLERDLI
jgi:hypothetical protein